MAMALTVTAVCVTALPGCGGNGCVGTSLKLRPVSAAGPHSPVTLRARLTANGKPVAGAKVLIRVTLKTSVQSSTGADQTVRTGTDGVAEWHIKGGLGSVGLSGDRVTGYEAHFEPYNKVKGVHYCWAHGSAPLE
jgi:hypothetical protein